MGTEIKDDLVSIVIPVYNAAHFLPDTLRSVTRQTYKAWEIILVDDASTDESCSVVESFLSEWKYAGGIQEIKLFSQSSNQGPAAARNRGIKEATGRYLAFLDADDLWDETKLERQLNFMIEKQAAFVYAAYRLMDAEGRETGKVRNVPAKTNYRKLLRGNDIPCLTVLIDRNIVPKIQMPDIPHEDYATWLAILKNGVAAYGLQEPLATYRLRGTSLSGNKLRAATWTWNIYRKQEKLGLVKSLVCFGGYCLNAVRKRI